MARRSRQSFLKRQRERQRAEKAAEKRQKRFARRSGVILDEDGNEVTEGEPGGEGQEARSDDGEPGEEEQAPVSPGAETADDASDQAGTVPTRQD